jgi:hypothetical protein
MNNLRTYFAAIAVLAIASCLTACRPLAATSIQPASAQSGLAEAPQVAGGTLNLVLANKNGFVIAADSRMSSSKPFYCSADRKKQLYCDNSQKLFRTGPKSAMVIAGFAVGHGGSPLDLEVASMLRSRFGDSGLPEDRGSPDDAEFWSASVFPQALTGVASLFDPKTNPNDLRLITTFAGFDQSGRPILINLVFTENWRSTGPLHMLAPAYTVQHTQGSVTSFTAFYAGIRCAADAILHGFYRSDDATIQTYYRQTHAERDDMPLEQMRTLAKAILRETKKFTPLVGGDDQIGVFPAIGSVQWQLPPGLATGAQKSPDFMLWKGLSCTDSHPQCPNAAVALTFVQDFQHPLQEAIPEFFLAGRFQGIPIALDNNYFVADSFEHVTLLWRGGPFYVERGEFSDCKIEVPNGQDLPPELRGKCQTIGSSGVKVDPNTVGAPKKLLTKGCVSQLPGGGVVATAGGECGPVAGVGGPLLQP